MIEIKLYKYNSAQETNGYRGVDYSQYVAIASTVRDNLDDTLDAHEITLQGLNFRDEFAPSTKFVLDISQDGVAWKTLHIAVDTDTVSQPIISKDDYFNHTISFIEAGVDAQNRVVDNIAVTYKLQDVTLDVKPTYSTHEFADVNISQIENPQYDKNFGHAHFTHGIAGSIVGTFTYDNFMVAHNFEWEMSDWHTGSWADWQQIKQNEVIPAGGGNTKQIQLPIPNLKCYSGDWGTQNQYFVNGYCSVEVVLERKLVGSNVWAQVGTPAVYHPSSADFGGNYGQAENIWTNDDTDGDVYYHITPSKGIIVGSIKAYKSSYNPITDEFFYGVCSQIATDYSPQVTTRLFTFYAEKNYSYRVTVRPHFGVYDKPYWVAGDYPAYWSDCTTERKNYYIYSAETVSNNKQPINISDLSVGVEFNVFQADEWGKMIFQSALPANAYDLFNKAVLATSNFRKVSGVICDETPKPYYLEESVKQQLLNTQIIENFYQQKNLWEIFMEIGKYIHARPLVRFGSDNRYVLGWKYYGQTGADTDSSHKVSVFNSRFIAEYISSLSSYVDNMVQLGGTITEVIAPKSSSEDFTVYNDVAELKVSKPITEIVEFWATRYKVPVGTTYYSDTPLTTSAGTTTEVLTASYENATYASMRIGTTTYYVATSALVAETKNLLDIPSPAVHGGTPSPVKLGAVYEYNVYKLLSIDRQTYPNKGYSIYYNLGTNIIRGLNYRLPTVNTGEEDDYAIKNILGLAFGITGNEKSRIKVNDYTFKVVYRTKDTMRSDQTRPDLRKYLLNTKYDNVPQHYQFNNQQDTVVDSVKFGINTFGKLVRTGNTTFSIVEWNNTLGALKNAGELYNIYGNLYYVSKATHTFYTDHIESEIEYTKDFNRLAQIIGIPSEPRFYEISEQSQIRREKAFNSYLLLGDDDGLPTDAPISSYINGNKGFDYVKQLLFTDGVLFPKYAMTVFKADANKPSANGTDYLVKTLNPISAYSTQNTMTLEWDMVDNFSAGEQVGEQTYIDDRTADEAYRELLPYQYPDSYGRTDLVDFAILSDVSMTPDQIRNLPESPLENVSDQYNNLVFRTPSSDMLSHNEGEVLLKDNREAMSFNANTQMLTDSDRFVLSSYMWQPNKENIKVGLLNVEVDKLSPSTIPDNAWVLKDIDFSTVVETNYLDIVGGSYTGSFTEDSSQRIDLSLLGGSVTGLSVVNGRVKIDTAGTYNFAGMAIENVRLAISRFSYVLRLEDVNGNAISTVASVGNSLGVFVNIPGAVFTTTQDNTYLALYVVCNSIVLLDSVNCIVAAHESKVSIGYPQTQILIGFNALQNAIISNWNSTEDKSLTYANTAESIVIYSQNVVAENANSMAHYFVFAKNVGDMVVANELDITARKFRQWSISTPTKSIFPLQ